MQNRPKYAKHTKTTLNEMKCGRNNDKVVKNECLNHENYRHITKPSKLGEARRSLVSVLESNMTSCDVYD